MLLNIDDKVKQLFDYYAILPADSINDDDVVRWREWLSQQRNGAMGYMERERSDPNKILQGARTLIVVALAQNPVQHKGVARCFTGEDYHIRVKNRLWELLEYIKTLHPTIKGRAIVDSAPLMEKVLAMRGGLGWIGRNSLLITKKGSFFNLGVLILDGEFDSIKGECLENHCGSCRRCVDACPVGAICEGEVCEGEVCEGNSYSCDGIDARKCISYLNMEAPRLGVSIEANDLHGWSLGCDICQMVCPWNLKP